MSNNKTIRYFHVDDEVLRVSWIPSALRTYYYQRHKEYFREAGDLEYQDNLCHCSFALLGQGSVDTVEYIIFETGEELLGQEESILKNSIIIIDLMALEKDSSAHGQVPAGNQTLDKLLELGIDKNKIYVLTAFEQAAIAHIGGKLEKDHILAKPIDATTLAPVLLKAAGLIL